MDKDRLVEETTIAKAIALMIWDETSYLLSRQLCVELGLLNSEKMPEHYDPEFVERWQACILEGEQYLMQRDRAH